MGVELVLLRVPTTIHSLAEIEDAEPFGTFKEVVSRGAKAFPDAGFRQHRLENPFSAGRFTTTCSAVMAVGAGAVVEVSGAQFGGSREICGSLMLTVRRVAAVARPVAGLSNTVRPVSYRRKPASEQLAMVLEKISTCFGGTLFETGGNRIDPSEVELA